MKLLLTFTDNRLHCDECYSPANVVLMFTCQHACGRACLKRLHEQWAKLSRKLEQDAS